MSISRYFSSSKYLVTAMPYMPRFIVWLIILCIILLVLAHYAYSAEDDGWNALLQNDAAQAETQFERELASDKDNLECLEGLYQSLLLQGKMNDAYNALNELTDVTTGRPIQGLFLLRLGVMADFTGRIREYNSFVEKLFSENTIDAYTRTVVAQIRHNTYLQDNKFVEAAAALTESTRIKMVSRVLGPVYFPDKCGIDYPTPVEADLQSPGYFTRDDITLDAGGRLGLGDIIPNDVRPGFAYVYLTLDSAESRDAALDLFSGSVCKVWINGKLVYSPALFRTGFINARNSRVISLHKGNNLILIKAIKNDTLQIGLRDITSGGRLGGIRVVPYAEKDWSGVKLQQYSGRIFSQEYQSPFMPELEHATGIAGDIWRNFYYQYTKNYGAGIEMNNELLRTYPESALVNYTVGSYYQGYANVFESKQRTLSMCEKYMRKAVSIKADYILPKIVLAKIYLASKQDSAGLKLLQQIEQENKNIPWVYRALAEQYAQEGWLALANTALSRYLKLYPEGKPDAIGFYLNVNEYPEAEKLFSEAVTEGEIPLYSKYKILMRLNRISQAEEVINEWHKYYSLALDTYLSAMIDIARYRGNYRKVGAYLEQSLQKNSHSTVLLKMLAENKIRQGEMKAGVALLKRAHTASLKYRPSMPELYERIEADSSDEFELQKFDIDLNTAIDYAKVEKKDYDRASYANLLNVRIVQVFSDLSTLVYEHKAFKVFGNEGIQQLAELNVGQGDIIECRTISPEGVEYIPESAENVSFDKAISMYGVGIDSVLEYSKRLTGKSVPVFYDRFEFESFNNPVLKSKYVLLMPVEMLDKIDIEGADPEVKIQGENAILIWNAELHDGVEPEEFMPLVEDVLEKVKVRIYSSELEVPNLIAHDKPNLSIKEVDELSRRICAGLQTTREKVETLYRWIAGNIHKNTDCMSARDAYFMRAGTPEARMKLFQAMLRAVGITSYPLLSNIPFSVAGRLPRKDRVESMSEFTLPLLLRVENEDPQKPDIWLRFTDDMRENRPADIGTLNQGALALEYSPLGTRLAAVREDSLEKLEVMSPEINILADGSAKVQGGVAFYGSAAAAPRKVLYNSIQAQQYAAQIASQLFPGIIDATYTYPAVADLEKGLNNWYQPLLITCSGRVLDYCAKRGNALYLAPFKGGEFVRNLIIKQPRIQPVLIQMDIQNSLSRSYTIPEGYAYMNVPLDRVITSSFGIFILDYNVIGRKLTVSGSILIPAQQIAPEDSELYNKFLTEIKEAAGRGILITQVSAELGEEIEEEGVVAPVIAGRFMVKHLPPSVKKVLVKEGTE